MTCMYVREFMCVTRSVQRAQTYIKQTHRLTFTLVSMIFKSYYLHGACDLSRAAIGAPPKFQIPPPPGGNHFDTSLYIHI